MKKGRHNRILDLIQRTPILTQDDLRKGLARAGVRINQATLSRDLRELGLVKTVKGYTLPQAGIEAQPSRALDHFFQEFVVDVREAENLLVLKTTSGGAQTVAARLDVARWPDIVGTLAGDDTVLVITKTKSICHKVASRIQEGIAG